MKNFEYLRPGTIDEALKLYEAGGAGSRLLAGGTELVNEIRAGKAQPDLVIDLKHIPGLDHMEMGADGLRVGALYTVRDAELSQSLRRGPYGVLSCAAGTVGSPQVRNKATIVGNVCRASPSADLIPPLMALGATARVRTAESQWTIALEDMFLGPGKTTLRSGEILTELSIPMARAHSGCGYYKLSPRKSLDLAVVGVAAMIRTNSRMTRCVEARIVLGAVAPTPMRARKAESILTGANLTATAVDEAARAAAEESRPVDDVRASAWYRRKMVAVAARRAIAIALEQIRQGHQGEKNDQQ